MRLCWIWSETENLRINLLTFNNRETPLCPHLFQRMSSCSRLRGPSACEISELSLYTTSELFRSPVTFPWVCTLSRASIRLVTSIYVYMHSMKWKKKKNLLFTDYQHMYSDRWICWIRDYVSSHIVTCIEYNSYMVASEASVVSECG